MCVGCGNFLHCPQIVAKLIMKTLPLPPIELLRERLTYDPDTGEIRWRTNRIKKLVGQIPGHACKKGYHRIVIGGRNYGAHRIAWKMHYGIDPPEGAVIDHINCVRNDNRITNLRVVSLSENNLNTKGRRANLPPGVQYFGKYGWRARVKWKGKELHLGLFSTVEEAVAARENWVAKV